MADERRVNFLPVFRGQMLPRKWNQLVLFGAHVIQVEGRVSLNGLGERRKLCRASMPVSLQRLLERADFLRTSAMFRFQLIDQRCPM